MKDIERVHKKRAHDKESRLETVLVSQNFDEFNREILSFLRPVEKVVQNLVNGKKKKVMLVQQIKRN